jgi:hypothetical protein
MYFIVVNHYLITHSTKASSIAASILEKVIIAPRRIMKKEKKKQMYDSKKVGPSSPNYSCIRELNWHYHFQMLG